MKVSRIACVALAIIGGVLVVLGCNDAPARAAYAWLVAVLFAYTIGCAALLVSMIGYATQAVWLVVLRRPLEAIAGALPLVALLFVPVLLQLDTIYPWAGGGLPLSEHAQELVRHKRAWLDEHSFVARSAVYLVAPALTAELFRRWSIRGAWRAARIASVVAIPMLGVVITFAMFDWLMSLEPAFYSSAFGLIPNAGAVAAVLGLLAVIVALAQRGGGLAEVTPEHAHALGKLMLAAVAVWAYLAFTQYFAVWLPDLPTEIRWYIPRTSSWWVVAIVLVIAHFALPFAVLLARAVKRRPAWLALPGALLVATHWIDLWWQAVPAIRPAGPDATLADPGALLLVAGAAALVAILRAARVASLPLGDPLLERGLRYQAESASEREPRRSDASPRASATAHREHEGRAPLRQSLEGLHARAIAWTAIVGTVVFAAAVAVAWWMTAERALLAHPPDVTPRGAIAAIERGQLDAVPRGLVRRARDEARLHQHGWTDRDRGLAHIPIVRAIDMAAAGCRPPGAGASAFEIAPDPSCPDPGVVPLDEVR